MWPLGHCLSNVLSHRWMMMMRLKVNFEQADTDRTNVFDAES